MKKQGLTAKTRLTIGFVLSAAGILFVAIGTVILVEYAILIPRLADKETLEGSFVFWIIMFCVASLVVGILLAVVISKVILRPINTVLDGMESLSNGEYSVRINPNKFEGMKDLAESFNSLATELENTEMLRSDFINDFSHELKTPIVSISGLVGLLKSGKIPPEKQKQYLSVIEEEVNRLTHMTTNILTLTKVEKQEILTGVTAFNLSEQIRTCILLLEKKWAKKKLKFSIDFEEYEICANEEMLKQVWLNVIDNAIKYATPKTEIIIEITKSAKHILVRIEDTGEIIPEEEIGKVFNKFYRAEKSVDGNGIGLSIVKNIVDLHDGEIWVECTDTTTAFTVKLQNC